MHSYRNEQKLFKNLAIFDSESICVNRDSHKQTETTTWIGKHVPILVAISSNLIPQLIFFCNAIPHHLYEDYCSLKTSNSKDSSEEIKFYCSRDCSEDITVSYTETTQPRTQPSAEGVEFCKRLYRGGGKTFIYTIPANANESNI